MAVRKPRASSEWVGGRRVMRNVAGDGLVFQFPPRMTAVFAPFGPSSWVAVHSETLPEVPMTPYPLVSVAGWLAGLQRLNPSIWPPVFGSGFGV